VGAAPAAAAAVTGTVRRGFPQLLVRLASRLDPDDATAGGLHVATFGGVW
jgi:hypothetical protein